MTSKNSSYNFTFRHFYGLIVCFLLSILSLRAQDRCGTVEYNKMIRKGIAPQDEQDQFENWLSRKIQKKNESFFQRLKQRIQ